MSSFFTGTSSDSAKDKYQKNYDSATSKSTEDKVNSTNIKALPGDPVGFITTLVGKIFHLFITIAIGSLILYSCKVAQANILPTSKECFPYTDIIAELTEKVINIDVVKNTDLGDVATKIVFPYKENMIPLEGGILGLLKSMIDGPDANVFGLYLAKGLQGVISLNLSMLNSVYSLINSFFPEWFIIFVIPYIMLIICIGIVLLNGIYLAIMWFYNMRYFISEPTTSPDGKTTWKKGNLFTLMNLFIMYVVIIIGGLLFMVVGTALIPLVSIFICILSLVMPLFMHAKIHGTKQKYEFKDAFMNVWKYKKNIIMYIISFLVIVDANSSYGLYTAFCVFIGCLILGHFTSVYHRFVPVAGVDFATPGLEDTDQAMKQCNVRYDFDAKSDVDTDEQAAGEASASGPTYAGNESNGSNQSVAQGTVVGIEPPAAEPIDGKVVNVVYQGNVVDTIPPEGDGSTVPRTNEIPQGKVIEVQNLPSAPTEPAEVEAQTAPQAMEGAIQTDASPTPAVETSAAPEPEPANQKGGRGGRYSKHKSNSRKRGR
jgi:hypothetical protein